MSTIGIGVSTSIGFIQVGGERLSPELVSNGDFSNGLTGWTVVPIVSEKSGQVYIGAGKPTASISQSILTAGKTYNVIVEVVNPPKSGTATVNDAKGGVLQTLTSIGSISFSFLNKAGADIYITSNKGAVFVINNVSVKEV
tara:strand:+ start:931 stop:1353 length:423 start_codon:yes stop_codon:yes gene_type:complete